MRTTTTSPQCLVCDTAFAPAEDWEKGEIIECEACGQEHEVVGTSDARFVVDLAPEVEEDWGE